MFRFSSDFDPVARRHVSDTVRQNALVLFGRDRCTHFRTVRAFLERLDIEHRAVDMNSADFAADELGWRIRKFIAHLTGDTALPQIFIRGEHVGTAMDFFKLWRKGTIQRLLGRDTQLADTVGPR